MKTTIGVGQVSDDSVKDLRKKIVRSGGEHHEVALGEIHQLGSLVDEDEAEGDQAVDAADGQAIEHELQNDVQGRSSHVPEKRGVARCGGRVGFYPFGRGKAKRCSAASFTRGAAMAPLLLGARALLCSARISGPADR